MNKLNAFVRLDFVTVKPYFAGKNMAIYAGVALYMSYLGGALTGMGMGLMLGTLFASYPFALCEKSNLDALYTTLSVNRRTVVRGRYLFTLALDLCIIAALFAVAVTFIFIRNETVSGEDVIEALTVAAVIFALTIVIQAVQFPIYFKFGYTKAKLLSLVPFFALMAAYFLLTSIARESALLNRLYELSERLKTGGIITLALLGVIIAAYVSYRLSLSFYKKREF
jgi:hypothetical protein